MVEALGGYKPKVAGSILGKTIGFFTVFNSSSCSLAPGYEYQESSWG
jgi:hypothetical protein